MRFKNILLSLTLVSINAFADAKYIDLTHDYSSQTLAWPTTEAYHVTHTINGLPGLYVSTRDYASNEHAGTHLDAPIHFAKGHIGISQIPLAKLIGTGIKVDVSKKVKSNPDYQISINDFQQWESKHGNIPANSVVLLSTGYGNVWPDWRAYSGTSKIGKASTNQMHFPGLDPKAAEWLVKEKKIKAVGIDTFSIDYGQTNQFPTHQVLTKNDIPIFENVASMNQVPIDHFTVYALPMKIQNGTGAPLRIIVKI